VDPRGARTAHHLRQNVIVNGTNLEGSTVQLAPEASAAITLNIAESSQDRLVAVLPENVIEGHYSLQVANAVGTDQVEVWLLRGETGEQGAPRTAAEVLTLLQSLGDPVPGLHAESAERSESLTDASGGAHTWAEIVGGAVPAGATMMFARNTCPSGWIPADGQAVSRATYAVLFAAIGVSFGVGDGVSTFTLPDLRGEFVRGWDDGRGADGGRSFASGQGSATRLLMNTYFSAENGLPGAVGDSAYGMITHSPGTFWAGLDFQPSGPSVYTVKRSASPAMDSTFGNATETRPRNVALLACIKS
jgi:microcystin-dependent protein